MSDNSAEATVRQTTESTDQQAITDGRYLYCLVDPTAVDTPEITVRGVDKNPVYVIQEREVAAVVHDCQRSYGTDVPEPELIKQRVLRHQQVVDAASDAFGTPLPMRFNTIFDGGDVSVTEWIQTQYDRVSSQLQSFAGTREYRISLLWDPTPFETRVETQDDRLSELHQRRQDADAGKSFLLEKQYDNQLRELKSDRREELTAELKQTVEPTAHELQEQDSSSPLAEVPDSTDGEQIARVAVLANQTDEADLGGRLDELVEHDGVNIKFTGPWPPYTFAPELG